jgi:pyridoxal phosphate enzyme (YggS family)
MYQTIIEALNKTNTQLVAVSKTKPNEQIMALYNLGQRVFGENYVQELVEKHEALPKDIEWHLIGHLQTNKVKYIAPFVDTIHSVDSVKLLVEINKQAAKHNRVIKCLLQIHIADEESKFGLSTEGGIAAFFDELMVSTYTDFKNVEICGVMGMATFTDDKNQVRQEFKKLKQIFNQLKSTYFIDNQSFKEISMGMSDDYKIAIEEGSTMVRIGSLLFGKR